MRLRLTRTQGTASGLMWVTDLLQHRFKRLEMAVSAVREEIPEQEYEDRIQEALRQLGI